MTQITVDDSTSKQLAAVLSPSEIRDRAGRLIGYFTPSVDASTYENLDPPESNEELRRIARDQTGRQLSDILRDLERRE